MKEFLTALLLALPAMPATASTMSFESTPCPVCLKDIFHRVQMSATVFDTRLDFKPLGAVLAPGPRPVCEECGFVVFASSAGPRELAAWRAVAGSAGYAALRGRSAYRRLAFIHAELRSLDDADIAQTYLKASWEEEGDREKMLEDLSLALQHLDAYAAGLEKGSREWPMANYLRAELLRRLSRFDEALKTLSHVRGGELPKYFREFVDYQRILCRRKDPAPHGISELRRRGLFTRLGDFFRGVF